MNDYYCYCWGGAWEPLQTSAKPRLQTYVWDGAYGIRQDNCETKKISWSINRSEFPALLSFPSGCHQVMVAMVKCSNT